MVAYLSEEPTTCTLPPSVMASWTAKISSRLLRRAVLGIVGISVLIYAGHSRVACHEKFGPHKMVSWTTKTRGI